MSLAAWLQARSEKPEARGPAPVLLKEKIDMLHPYLINYFRTPHEHESS